MNTRWSAARKCMCDVSALASHPGSSLGYMAIMGHERCAGCPSDLPERSIESEPKTRPGGKWRSRASLLIHPSLPNPKIGRPEKLVGLRYRAIGIDAALESLGCQA